MRSSRCSPRWPTRAFGTSSSIPGSMPRPARSTGAITTSAARRRHGDGPSGVSTVPSTVGTSRSASAPSSTLMRLASARNRSGGVRESRSSARQSCTSGMVDELQHGAESLHAIYGFTYNSACMTIRVRGVCAGTASLAAALAWPALDGAAQQPAAVVPHHHQRHRRHRGRHAAHPQSRVRWQSTAPRSWRWTRRRRSHRDIKAAQTHRRRPGRS